MSDKEKNFMYKEEKPVGRIDYLSSKGEVAESMEYSDAESFIKSIEDNNDYGVPMTIVLYKDENGNTISRDFIRHLDPPPQGLEIIDAPYLSTNDEKMVLFTVIQYGFFSRFKMKDSSLSEIMQQFKSAKHPFVDMKGEVLTAEKFAELEQSDKVTMSITADMDNNNLKVYEINGILETERSDDNVLIQNYPLATYVKNLKDDEEVLYILHGYWSTPDSDGVKIIKVSRELASAQEMLDKIAENKAKDYINLCEEIQEEYGDRYYEVFNLQDGSYAKFYITEEEISNEE